MAALLLLAPETPLIFMGQELDESAPFQFFADFGDQQLRKIVSDGRRSEFSGFSSFENDFPDPHDPATYERSHLSWNLGTDRLQMLEWYRDLIRLRKALYAKGDKTCATRALGEHGIEMQVPAARPKLRLAGTWARDVSSGANQGWKKVLESAEGDYRLQVWASPEVAMPLRESPAAD
jgi:maltooligosyltrehalose trehalohydrolase